jgi:hypothetical protein
MRARINIRHTFYSDAREDEINWYRLICRELLQKRSKTTHLHCIEECAMAIHRKQVW